MRERKDVVMEERVRRVPKQFSWVDHRLVRDGFCRRCRPEELALYLMLVTVGDAEGLSYYSERSLARLVNVAEPAVAAARDGGVRGQVFSNKQIDGGKAIRRLEAKLHRNSSLNVVWSAFIGE